MLQSCSNKCLLVSIRNYKMCHSNYRCKFKKSDHIRSTYLDLPSNFMIGHLNVKVGFEDVRRTLHIQQNFRRSNSWKIEVLIFEQQVHSNVG